MCIISNRFYLTPVTILRKITNNTPINNTAIGKNADFELDTLSNSTALGSDALCNLSNKVRIGDTNITEIEGQVAFSQGSDGRFKNTIQE